MAMEMKPVAKRMEAISGERSAEPAAAGASAIAAGRGPGLVPASFALTAATAKFSATATHERAVQAKDFDQHRGRGERAEHRADHVGQVEVAEAGPVAFVDFADERHHERVREPHQDAPGQDRNAQHQGREEQVAGRIHRAGRQQRRLARREDGRNQQAAYSYKKLGSGVVPSRGPPAAQRQRVDPAPARPRAERKAEHEDRQDDGEHGRDDAESGEREPEPDHLVEQPAEAGREEEAEERNVEAAPGIHDAAALRFCSASARTCRAAWTRPWLDWLNRQHPSYFSSGSTDGFTHITSVNPAAPPGLAFWHG